MNKSSKRLIDCLTFGAMAVMFMGIVGCDDIPGPDSAVVGVYKAIIARDYKAYRANLAVSGEQDDPQSIAQRSYFEKLCAEIPKFPLKLGTVSKVSESRDFFGLHELFTVAVVDGRPDAGKTLYEVDVSCLRRPGPSLQKYSGCGVVALRKGGESYPREIVANCAKRNEFHGHSARGTACRIVLMPYIEGELQYGCAAKVTYEKTNTMWLRPGMTAFGYLYPSSELTIDFRSGERILSYQNLSNANSIGDGAALQFVFDASSGKILRASGRTYSAWYERSPLIDCVVD